VFHETAIAAPICCLWSLSILFSFNVSQVLISFLVILSHLISVSVGLSHTVHFTSVMCYRSVSHAVHLVAGKLRYWIRASVVFDVSLYSFCVILNASLDSWVFASALYIWAVSMYQPQRVFFSCLWKRRQWTEGRTWRQKTASHQSSPWNLMNPNRYRSSRLFWNVGAWLGKAESALLLLLP